MVTETEYTSIPVKPTTKERLAKQKITEGEYWDDLINRLLDKIEGEVANRD